MEYMPRRAQCLLVFSAIAFLTLAAFSPILNSYFVSDDPEFLLRADKIAAHPALLFRFFTSSGLDPRPLYRPLLYATLTSLYFFAGTQPFLFHLANILAHILAACLVYGLVTVLLAPEEAATGLPAFLAAALFALHPIHHEPVVWINTVDYPLLAIFYLITLICHIRYDRGAGPRALLISLGFFAVALTAAEAAVSAPGVIMLYRTVWRSGRARGWAGKAREIIGPVVPYLAVLAGYFLLRKFMFGTMAIRLEGYFTKTYSLKYFASDFIRLHYPLSHPRYFSVLQRCAGALVSPVIIIAGLIVSLARRRGDAFRLILFGALWQGLSLAALYFNFGCALFPPRFFYIPSLGFCIAMGGALAVLLSMLPRARGEKAAAGACAGAICLLCVTGLRLYLSDWERASAISMSIRGQMEIIISGLPAGENFVLLNTPYGVWPAAYIYNRHGPAYFMEPPFSRGRYSSRVAALNVEQFPEDIRRAKEMYLSGTRARYYCWNERAMKMCELPSSAIAALREADSSRAGRSLRGPCSGCTQAQ